MTQQEYEQKREQEWRAFCNRHGIIDRGHVILFSAFFDAFDRAYALGREKEIISQDEIDKAAEDYVSFKKGGKCMLSYIIGRACLHAFKGGANFALGKQEKDAETVIQGWVCRDKKDNALNLHLKEPYRTYSNFSIVDKTDLWESDCASCLPLDNSLFPDLTWESDPQEWEIIIKRKKNG